MARHPLPPRPLLTAHPRVEQHPNIARRLSRALFQVLQRSEHPAHIATSSGRASRRCSPSAPDHCRAAGHGSRARFLVCPGGPAARTRRAHRKPGRPPQPGAPDDAEKAVFPNEAKLRKNRQNGKQSPPRRQGTRPAWRISHTKRAMIRYKQIELVLDGARCPRERHDRRPSDSSLRC